MQCGSAGMRARLGALGRPRANDLGGDMKLRKRTVVAAILAVIFLLGGAFLAYKLLKPAHPTLIEAIRANDVQDVRKHLFLGAGPYDTAALKYVGTTVQGPVAAAALCSRYPELVEALIDGGLDLARPLSFIQEDGNSMQRSPLLVAIESDTTGPTQVLLEHGAPIEPSQETNEPAPLIWAVQLDRLSAARLLMEYGANPNVRNGAGLTPLALALSLGAKGSPEFVKLLCTHGANVNDTDSLGLTPLHYACTQGSGEAVVQLINFGADVNRQDIQGRTPLHYASERCLTTAMQALLNAGASLKIKDKNKENPLELCIRIRQLPSVAFLLDWRKENEKKK